MDSGYLKSLIDRLISDEDDLNIQSKLGDFVNSIERLSANPNNEQIQIEVSDVLAALSAALLLIEDRYSPADRKSLREISADRFFDRSLAENIKSDIADNPITPAVVRQSVTQLAAERKSYLDSLRAITAGLSTLNILPSLLNEGDAEVGFTLPRPLFNNDLDGLIKELRTINRVIRAFGELVTGSAEPAEIHSISTSDPSFFFGLNPVVAAAIGGAVTWALNTWKQVEEIRKVRAETRKLTTFTEKEVEDFFGTKVEEIVTLSIDRKVKELLPNLAEAGRAKEQAADLGWALRALLARIERGMLVEVRFLPPAQTDDDEEPERDAFTSLKQIVSQLTFPEPDDEPVLALPPTEPPSSEDEDPGN